MGSGDTFILSQLSIFPENQQCFMIQNNPITHDPAPSVF